MVENSHKGPVCEFLRSFSFEGSCCGGLSYHEKYYYPRLAYQRCTLKMEPVTGEPKITGRAKQARSTVDAANAASCTSTMSQDAALWDRSESLQSNESNFSEDYTRMTDGESGDWERQSPAERGSWSSDDFSDHASLTTIDNDDDTRNVNGSPEGGGGNAAVNEDNEGTVFVNSGLARLRNLDGAMPPDKLKRSHALKLDTSKIIITPPDDSPAEAVDDPLHLQLCNSTEEDSGATEPSCGESGGCEPTPHMEHSDSSSFFEDREFDFLKLERVKRSTSLKTNKTPPGTPSRKKAVRFADALGLDLESVRHILSLDSPPKIPESAMHDLQIGLREQHKETGNKYLSACFPQPGAMGDFYQQVRANNVRLENCLVDDKTMTVTGTVKVMNVSYHKAVTVRYSVNGWVSYEDICASYVMNSNDGPTDRFSFTINVPYYFNVGSKLEFCIFYTAGGRTYWDSNGGKNYAVECFAQAVPTSSNDTSWMHFL